MGNLRKLIFCILLNLKLCGASWVVKVTNDITVHNYGYSSHVKTVFSVTQTKCKYECDKHTNGTANLRKYNRNSQTCECLLASEEDFRDSRKVAPELDGVVFLVNPELLLKEFHLAPCDIQLTPEHTSQISMKLETGVSKDDCLANVAETSGDPNVSAVFCPDEEICGSQLDLNETRELKRLPSKTCTLFVRNISDCGNLHNQLIANDVNECEQNETECGEGAEACVNLYNHGYDCLCLPGYEKDNFSNNGTVKCEDINECEGGEDPCPGPNEICNNSLGNYSCPCESAGFVRLPENEDCSDIDECQILCSKNTEDCQNELGSFSCSCKLGFERDSSHQDCVHINECSEGSDECANKTLTCLNGFQDFECAAEELKDFNIFGYSTEEYKVLDEKCAYEKDCICDDHYMTANFNGSTFCINTFFLTNGDVNNNPVCEAYCCSFDCSWIQPIDGSVSSAYWKIEFNVNNLWDGDLGRASHNDGGCFATGDDLPQTVDLILGKTYNVTAVSLLNHPLAQYAQLLNELVIHVCDESPGGDDCKLCGPVKSNAFNWNYLRCIEVITGSRVYIEAPSDPETITFCEILIHVETF